MNNLKFSLVHYVLITNAKCALTNLPGFDDM